MGVWQARRWLGQIVSGDKEIAHNPTHANFRTFFFAPMGSFVAWENCYNLLGRSVVSGGVRVLDLARSLEFAGAVDQDLSKGVWLSKSL